MILKKGAPTAHLFCICIFRVTQAKLKNELFKLFAKVLLALRPFAMCLKTMKFCSTVEESILLYFFECGVFRWLPLTFSGFASGVDLKVQKFIQPPKMKIVILLNQPQMPRLRKTSVRHSYLS
jgi:hypothetical protein